MEWPQVAIMFASGAAGCLSTAKLMRMVSARSDRQRIPAHPAGLFLNGDREEFTTKVADLIAANSARKADHRAIVARVEELERCTGTLTEKVDENERTRTAELSQIQAALEREARGRMREERDIRGIIEYLTQRVDVAGQ